MVQGRDHDSKANVEVFVQFTAVNRYASRYCRPSYIVCFIYSCLADNTPENKLDVSFLQVKYVDIALFVGLEPCREGFDIEPFAMLRA